MHFLGCLFALFLGVIFIGVAFLGSVIDFILSLLGLKKRVNNTSSGFGSQRNAYGSQQRGYDSQQDGFDSQQNYQQHEHPHGQHKGKIFTKDESEYVDFEEV